MLQAVLFDFDGTIGDTLPLVVKGIQYAVHPFCRRNLSYDEIAETFGPCEEGSLRLLVPEHYSEAVQRFYKYYRENHSLCPSPFEGIIPLINSLRSKKILTGLITGKGKFTTQLSLEQYDMKNCFDFIKTGSDQKSIKTDCILQALHEHNLYPEKTVYIGDMPGDIDAARAASVKIASVLYSSSHQEKKLKAKQPDAMCYSVNELQLYLHNLTKTNNDKNTSSHFGTTLDGTDISLYTITDDIITAKISTFGAALVSLNVPGKDGMLHDIVLGYDNVNSYEQQTSYIGSIVGRCCNRISDAAFTINDKKYLLSTNEGKNHLHGGFKGFDKKTWQIQQISKKNIKLSYLSPDGEEGYPGNLSITVIYSIKDSSLYIDYYAKSDADTLCNLTNHSYFNLNGYNSGSILGQYIQINSDTFNEDNEHFMPTGRILPVENTPLDFRKAQLIGKNIADDYYQIKQAHGYNVNYIMKQQNDDKLIHFATAYAKESGIIMKLYSNMPCCEFYSGSYLHGNTPGKRNAVIDDYYGFCLEPQFAPNAINIPKFITPILRSGEQYHKRSVFKFYRKNHI